MQTKEQQQIFGRERQRGRAAHSQRPATRPNTIQVKALRAVLRQHVPAQFHLDFVVVARQLEGFVEVLVRFGGLGLVAEREQKAPGIGKSCWRAKISRSP